MSAELESELRRLSNLKQNKKKDRVVLEKQAKINLWKKWINIASRFESAEDKTLAKELFDNYLDNYEFSDYNDIQNVADLVYAELLKQRIQETISKTLSDVKNNFIPEKVIQSLHTIQDRILVLKEKAGISVTKEQDALNSLEELQKKFEVYIPFHRNEYSLEVPSICKSCGHEDVQMYLLRRRCNKENFEVLKHPVFSGRYLYNIEIIDDVRNGKITKEMAARYLRTSSEYISWVLENEYKIIEIENVKKEDIDELVNKNPFLRSAEEYNQK